MGKYEFWRRQLEREAARQIAEVEAVINAARFSMFIEEGHEDTARNFHMFN